MKFRTVKGLVPIEDVVLADGHAHLWIDASKCPNTGKRPNLTDYSAIEAELHDFKSAGGTTLIDCQPGGCGRDANILVNLSDSTGLQITATTGFHKKEYYPPGSWLWLASMEEVLSYLVEELTYGMRESETNICATTIKVAPEDNIKGQVRILMEAAAEASHRTGAVILCHTEKGRNAENLFQFFTDRGVLSSHLYFCHMDKRPDITLHRELAKEGVLLGYDTFARPKYNPEYYAWRLLRTLVEDGLYDCISIGSDLASADMWQHCGGQPGMLYLPNVIVPRLYAEGFPQSIVDKLTGLNVVGRVAKSISSTSSKL
jgi:phosphotriesterase-related protein